MLIIKFEPGKPGVVMVNGNLERILTELSYGIKGIYEQMKKVDETAAMCFKDALKMGLEDENGPVWGSEMPHHFGMGIRIPAEEE